MKDTMQKVGEHMDATFNQDGEKHFGWMVLVFPFGKNKIASYVSNCNRRDMIATLREKADVLERQLDNPPIESN